MLIAVPRGWMIAYCIKLPLNATPVIHERNV